MDMTGSERKNNPHGKHMSTVFSMWVFSCEHFCLEGTSCLDVHFAECDLRFYFIIVDFFIQQ